MAGHLSEIFCRIHGVILAGACGGILSSQITSSQIGLSIRYLFEIIFISEQFSLFFIGTKPLTVLNRLKVQTSLDATHGFATNSIRTLDKFELALIIQAWWKVKKFGGPVVMWYPFNVPFIGIGLTDLSQLVVPVASLATSDSDGPVRS